VNLCALSRNRHQFDGERFFFGVLASAVRAPGRQPPWGGGRHGRHQHRPHRTADRNLRKECCRATPTGEGYLKLIRQGQWPKVLSKAEKARRSDPRRDLPPSVKAPFSSLSEQTFSFSFSSFSSSSRGACLPLNGRSLWSPLTPLARRCARPLPPLPDTGLRLREPFKVVMKRSRRRASGGPRHGKGAAPGGPRCPIFRGVVPPIVPAGPPPSRSLARPGAPGRPRECGRLACAASRGRHGPLGHRQLCGPQSQPGPARRAARPRLTRGSSPRAGTDGPRPALRPGHAFWVHGCPGQGAFSLHLALIQRALWHCPVCSCAEWQSAGPFWALRRCGTQCCRWWAAQAPSRSGARSGRRRCRPGWMRSAWPVVVLTCAATRLLLARRSSECVHGLAHRWAEPGTPVLWDGSLRADVSLLARLWLSHVCLSNALRMRLIRGLVLHVASV